jgi:hypothetical protein
MRAALDHEQGWQVLKPLPLFWGLRLVLAGVQMGGRLGFSRILDVPCCLLGGGLG